MATSPVDPAPRADDSPRPAGSGGRRPAALLALAAAALAVVAMRPLASAGQGSTQKSAAAPALRQAAPRPAPAPAPGPPAVAEDPPAEKAFKNIKVLQGMPASQMAPIMHVMRASLGVRCDYCHVIENDRYDLDTKPEKETSREMVRMVFEINKNHFGGTTEVSCQTCHHGQTRPARVPAMELGFITGPSNPPPVEKLPSATAVLDRYIQALGGRAALEGVRSRVSRGTLLHIKVIGAGTPDVHGINRGQEDPLEIVELRDRATMTFGPPSAPTVETFEGGSVRIQTPQGERPLTPTETARLASRFDLRRDLKLRDRAEKSRVVGKDRIDGREVFLLRTTMPDGNPALLSFDAQTGLLRRQAVYRPTLIGPDPEQTDFEDYRDVGGVKVPFLVKTSLLDDFHYGLTRKLTEVRDNVGG